jgi:hypothetical protein
MVQTEDLDQTKILIPREERHRLVQHQNIARVHQNVAVLPSLGVQLTVQEEFLRVQRTVMEKVEEIGNIFNTCDDGESSCIR